MIEGFETQTARLTEDEERLIPMLVQQLSKKKGKAMAVTNKDIEKAFQKINVNISGARIRKLINHIRTMGLVELLCATSNGYYVAKTNKEVESYLTGLKARIDAQQHMYDMIKLQYNHRLNTLKKNDSV